ncbi:hypothetical protein DL95DRAFT_418315 [Leptodontidium sp. 2 PMI_412]|nr:hypothetical protein DL95DRAFT_418315 [Leptodontidium sp. 2 PMI_412]
MKIFLDNCKYQAGRGERGRAETVTRLPKWRTRRQWLLVFDNADDIDLWFPGSDDPHKARGLSEYLPRSRERAIVFTTRDRKMAVKLTGQNVLEVSQMDESTARQLLRNRLVDQRLVDAVDDTTTLLEQLPFLPSATVQAIAQAATYINQNRIAFSDYLSLLAEQEEDGIILLRKTSRTKEDSGM